MKLNLGENIRENRRRMGLTQEQLADRLGVSFQSVSRWEKGTTYPDMEKLPEIARLFEVSTDALFGYGEKEEKSYSEVLAELEDVLASEDEDEICRLFRLVRHEYREDFLCGDYLANGRIHPVLNLNYTDILSRPRVLEEMRAFAADYLGNGTENIYRGQLIRRMAELEDDEHIDDFIKDYSSDTDISKLELFGTWYGSHGMCEKQREYRMYKDFERLRLFLCEECSDTEDPTVRLKAYGEKFDILNILSGIEADEKYPVSGNGEVDVWSGVRYRLAFDYAACLAENGQYEKAIRALEDAREIIEKLIALPHQASLGCKSNVFGNIELEVCTTREIGLLLFETPRGQGELPYKNVIPMFMVSIGNVPYILLNEHLDDKTFSPIENEPRFKEILHWADSLRLTAE